MDVILETIKMFGWYGIITGIIIFRVGWSIFRQVIG